MLPEQCDSKLCSFKDLGCQRRTLPPEDRGSLYPEGNLEEEVSMMNSSPHLVTSHDCPLATSDTSAKGAAGKRKSHHLCRVIGPHCQMEVRLLQHKERRRESVWQSGDLLGT